MRKARVYLASSWRNKYYPDILKKLRDAGFEVYDFRESPTAFKWSDIDNNWQNWSNGDYYEALGHPLAEAGFQGDLEGINNSDACVLLLPCGRSAQVEAGIMAGDNKVVIALMLEKEEPELMYKLFTDVVFSVEDAIELLNQLSYRYRRI